MLNDDDRKSRRPGESWRVFPQRSITWTLFVIDRGGVTIAMEKGNGLTYHAWDILAVGSSLKKKGNSR